MPLTKTADKNIRKITNQNPSVSFIRNALECGKGSNLGQQLPLNMIPASEMCVYYKNYVGFYIFNRTKLGEVRPEQETVQLKNSPTKPWPTDPNKIPNESPDHHLSKYHLKYGLLQRTKAKPGFKGKLIFPLYQRLLRSSA